MEASVAHGRQRRGHSNRTAYDDFLIKSKTEKRDVDVELPVPTSYSDEDGFCTMKVIHVDRFSVEFQSLRDGKRRWINKAFIVSVGLSDG